MQNSSGGGEGAAGTGADGGGEKVDRGILILVGAAGVVRAEPGGRGSGQAGNGGGATQIERLARVAERGGGSDLWAVGGGTFRDGGEGIRGAGRGCDFVSTFWLKKKVRKNPQN